MSDTSSSPGTSTATTELTRYDAARRALAEAHRVDEVKDIRDKAVAMQTYARQAQDTSLITQATEIRMRAERRAGELLIEMAERKERAKAGDADGSTRRPSVPKLSDLGINKTQSSRWQELAKLDVEVFESKVEATTKRAYNSLTGRLLKAERIKEAKAQHAKRVNDGGCTVADLTALAESGKRFGVIYADPAWPWQTWGGDSGKIHTSVDTHYGTSPLAEIAALPVAQLAADDCALLLWCTWPHVSIGTHVKIIEAWGLKPSSCAFVWVKTKDDGSLFVGDECPTTDDTSVGNGYGTRSNSEVCLLATKGSPLRLHADVRQVVFAPVGEHSEKPAEVRRRIERLFAGPYLELYARKPAEGWTSWGNEIARAGFAQMSEAAE
jgi:N6-adenosine-specific RNA methylase IME4